LTKIGFARNFRHPIWQAPDLPSPFGFALHFPAAVIAAPATP